MMPDGRSETATRDRLLDLANRALLASVAGTSLKVAPDEFALLKRLNDEEWDASVMGAWKVALAEQHPMTQHPGVLGQPWALAVEVVGNGS